LFTNSELLEDDVLFLGEEADREVNFLLLGFPVPVDDLEGVCTSGVRLTVCSHGYMVESIANKTNSSNVLTILEHVCVEEHVVNLGFTRSWIVSVTHNFNSDVELLVFWILNRP